MRWRNDADDALSSVDAEQASWVRAARTDTAEDAGSREPAVGIAEVPADSHGRETDTYQEQDFAAPEAEPEAETDPTAESDQVDGYDLTVSVAEPDAADEAEEAEEEEPEAADLDAADQEAEAPADQDATQPDWTGADDSAEVGGTGESEYAADEPGWGFTDLTTDGESSEADAGTPVGSDTTPVGSDTTAAGFDGDAVDPAFVADDPAHALESDNGKSEFDSEAFERAFAAPAADSGFDSEITDSGFDGEAADPALAEDGHPVGDAPDTVDGTDGISDAADDSSLAEPDAEEAGATAHSIRVRVVSRATSEEAPASGEAVGEVDSASEAEDMPEVDSASEADDMPEVDSASEADDMPESEPVSADMAGPDEEPVSEAEAASEEEPVSEAEAASEEEPEAEPVTDPESLPVADLTSEAETVSEPRGPISEVPDMGAAGYAAALIPAAEVESLRDRWRDVQAAFVDDPRRAVQDADALLGTAWDLMRERFESERSELADDWRQVGDPDTEQLRMAFRRYRDLLDTVLRAERVSHQEAVRH